MSADLIRAGLNSTRTELAEVIPHLSDDILDWAPASGMRTIQGQFVEIIGTESSILELLKGIPRRPAAEVDAELFQLKTVESLVAKLTEVRGQTWSHLDSLTEAQLNEPLQISDGFKKYLELAEVPASEMLRFIIRHEAYHTGQLVSYLWARGNNPYDW